MRILLKTALKYPMDKVFSHFDEDLFKALTPSDKQLKLLRFDGSKKGDEIHLEFQFPLKRSWISVITEEKQGPDSCYFIDEGTVLPFGLKTWTHKHVVKKMKDGCEIIDDIEYKATSKLLTILMYIPLYLAFYPRKKAYKKHFHSLFNQK
jgi:ligand-binding SRPBCC domain-containing protein